MTEPSRHCVHRLGTDDIQLMRSMLAVFADAFEDPEHYASNPPGDEYLRRLLGRDCFIALVATRDQEVVGGIAAYELIKFEQERSEIYIYDLAVTEAHRRQGIASGLIQELKNIAVTRGAYVVYVQADLGDEPAVALYTKLGIREDVLHFDIPVA